MGFIRQAEKVGMRLVVLKLRSNRFPLSKHQHMDKGRAI